MGDLEQHELVFRARGLTKIYRMGEVEVQALRGIDLELHPDDKIGDGTRVQPR